MCYHHLRDFAHVAAAPGITFIALTVPSTAFFTTASGAACAKAVVETTAAARKADR